MKVRHTLICFFFLSLQDGNTGLVNAQIVYSGTEGGNITVKCPFTFFGSRKLFCKGECNQEDILIETYDVRAQSGRYRIEYEQGYARTVFVSISQLTKSDSGLYRCVLSRTLSSASYVEFEIIVIDALLDGNPSEEKTLHTRTGGNIIVECFFTSSGNRKYFCKEECEDKDILVETTGLTAQRGRYSIRYIRGSLTGGFLYVSITQLTKSDSGWYRCALDKPVSPDPYRRFEIIVTDAPTTSKPNLTLPAFSTSVPSAFTPTTTQSLSSNPGSPTPSTTRDAWLYVGLTLAVMIVLLSLAVLIYCRKRSSKPKEPPVETEYASVTEANRAYEDIREDRQSRSPPVGISSVYTHAKYTKRNGAETNDDYSFVTTASSQNTAEDDSSKLIYAEVNFSNRTAGSSNSALRGDGDNVVYSVPQVEARRAEDDPPVYSTVT